MKLAQMGRKDWDEMVNACPIYENSSEGLFQQESGTNSLQT